MNIIRF